MGQESNQPNDKQYHDDRPKKPCHIPSYLSVPDWLLEAIVPRFSPHNAPTNGIFIGAANLIRQRAA
jgi:hypothetical protein